MIGSISKVRPCGHHHYYKYAHATGGRHPELNNGKKYDMYQVSREYWKDVDEDNCWNFSLENAERLCFCCFELGRFTKFKSKTPKLTYAYEMFTGDNGRTSPTITEIEMDYDNLTNVYCLFYGMKLNDLPANFNPKTTDLNHLMGGNCAVHITQVNGKFPFHEVINNATGIRHLCRVNGEMDERYTFENATNAFGMAYANGFTKVPPQLSLKNVTNFQNANYVNTKIEYFQTVDEMSEMANASNAFAGCTNFSSLYPDYDSFRWPKLSAASSMFKGCILDKSSILKLKDALPDWSGDTTEHNITIGCHKDHMYDPEVNLALKKIDMSYESVTELAEEVTTDKGWNATIQWNVTNHTKNECPNPYIQNLLNENVILPEGYTKLNYLEATGTQFIDTEYIPTDTTGIWNLAKMIVNQEGYTVSSRNTNYYVYPPSWAYSTISNYYGWGTTASFTPKGNMSFYESSLNYLNSRKAVIKLDAETQYSFDLGTLTNPPSCSLYIFGRNNSGTLEKQFKGRIYRVKISEGDTIEHDFIPCLNSDGKPCMYDIIKGKEYTNQASGDDFLYG